MLDNQEIRVPILIEDLGQLAANENSSRTRRFGIYECGYCGNRFKTMTQSIKNGKAKSCGCYQKDISSKMAIERFTIHGFRSHRLYSVWNDMISRCNNSNCDAYLNYGARGITVCERWLNIANFIEDMYPSFEEGLTIDRRNNDLGYSPDNCRWTTKAVQSRNTRRIYVNNTSGYRGVSFSKKCKKWKAEISINRKHILIGYFNTPLEAGIAYDTYVINNNLEHTTNSLLQNHQLTFVES